ncbi:MAG: peptide chain release factor N(5)-glutamine methyltransferase [Chloroflexaceae bacterium]|nr:peptide chain release factor N(5)-glutamine methyltransferase [Chloroflexaceae bacterium]NJO06442.1 peptide chain release factor N(5)-glutamine methyltransferase [Chloroflexaceae bacterium]
MNIRHLLHEATVALRDATPTPRLDAELLLAHVLGWSRARLLAEYHLVPTADLQQRFRALLERRSQQEPVAYLVGSREFYGLELLVDERVLIPRPETELLVELALAHIATRRAGPLSIVDVGTGTGAIALALAQHIPPDDTTRIYAVDIAADALAVAAVNVARHDQHQRIALLHGDLLAPLPPALRGQIDLLVSNPPYTILSEVEDNVRRYEPHLALDGGLEGLAVYQRLITQAQAWLHPQGAVLLEIGAWQGQAVRELVQAAFPATAVTIHPDLAGHDRVVTAIPRQAGVSSTIL